MMGTVDCLHAFSGVLRFRVLSTFWTIFLSAPISPRNLKFYFYCRIGIFEKTGGFLNFWAPQNRAMTPMMGHQKGQQTKASSWLQLWQRGTGADPARPPRPDPWRRSPAATHMFFLSLHRKVEFPNSKEETDSLKTPFWTTVSPHDAFAAPLARSD